MPIEACHSADLIISEYTVNREGHNQEEIVRHRLAELDRIRRINERRCAASRHIDYLLDGHGGRAGWVTGFYECMAGVGRDGRG